MARSLKKGPFADEHLLKKVDAMNASGVKRSSGPGPAVTPFSRPLSVIPLPYMMEESMFRSMSLKTWSAISWASSS